MQGIAEVINQQNPGWMNRLNSIHSKFYSHPKVVELREKYPDHFPKMHQGDLKQYILEQTNCQNCPGLEVCPNMMKGHRLTVVDDEEFGPQFEANPCTLHENWYRQQMIKKHVKSHHVPDYILNSTFKDLELDAGRKAAIAAAMKFCKDFERGKTVKGLYFFGDMGVGKSAISGAISNELAKRGVDVVIIYLPKFFSEMKEAIGSNSVQEKLKVFEEVSVLILDDIGAENLTNWTRDEILMQILNSRMNTLPTIYSSNLTLSELEQHLSRTKDGIDPTKAKRIMERIEPFVDVYEVIGPNRRRGE